MVYLYAANILNLQDPLENPEIMKDLPKERQNKILNCKQKQKRMQSFGAGLLLQKVLSRRGISTEHVYVKTGGKPIVDGAYFNLAHSGNVVICALADKPVGCDIEQIKAAPKRVASSFSDTEREHLQKFEGVAYNREFFRIWTKKESYLKMTGIGIRVPLDKVKIKECHIKEYEMQDYQITVCAEENEFANIIWENI